MSLEINDNEASGPDGRSEQSLALAHARDIAGRALFHTEVLKTATALNMDADRRHSEAALRALIRQVPKQAFEPERRPVLGRLKAVKRFVFNRRTIEEDEDNAARASRISAAYRRFRALDDEESMKRDASVYAVRWQEVVEASGEESIDAEALKGALIRFIGEGGSRWRRLLYFLGCGVNLARKHLGVLTGVMAGLFMLSSVAQIRELLLQEIGAAVGYMLLFIGAPLIGLLGSTYYLRWRGRISFWSATVFMAHPAARPPVTIAPFSNQPRTLRGILVLSAFAKLAIALFWCVPIGIEVWHQAPDWEPTVGCIICIFAVLLAILNQIDYLDWLERFPIRLVILVVAVGLGATLFHCSEPFEVIAWVLVIGVGGLLVSWIMGLLRWEYAVLLMVLVLLSLLGARSAQETQNRSAWRSSNGFTTEGTLLTGDEWPHRPPDTPHPPPVVVVAASGGGSRAAIFTAKLFRALSTLCPTDLNSDGQCEPGGVGTHLQAVGCVSGGSLATASYISLLYNALEDDELFGPEDCESGRPLAGQLDCLTGKLAADFFKPILAGAFTFGKSRSDVLEAYWEETFFLDEFMSDIAEAFRRHRDDPSPPFPVPLIQSATLDSHAVVVSPLAHSAYSDGLYELASTQHSPGGEGEATWVHYRSGIIGLDNLITTDATLSMAVRASANFPFGFPLVKVVTTRSLPFSPNPDDRLAASERSVFLTDGGVLNNSGLWSLYHLLSNTAQTIRDRGVIIIAADASKMPTFHGRSRLTDLVKAIGDRNPLADNLHRRMFDALHAKLDGRLAFIEVGLPPGTATNVYTSWALDEGSRKALSAGFDRSWPKAAQSITEAWRLLANGQPVDCSSRNNPLCPGPRMPVD